MICLPGNCRNSVKEECILYLFPQLVLLPPLQDFRPLDKLKPVLAGIELCISFRESVTGLIVQHFADRNGGSDPSHLGHRDRELGLAFPDIEKAICGPEKRHMTRRPECFVEVHPTAVEG